MWRINSKSTYLLMKANAPRPQLGLGTVQWGLPYGVSRKQNAPPVAESKVSEILAEAAKQGIVFLDTGTLYGKAESILGENSLVNFKVITKTPKFSSLVITNEQVALLANACHRSLANLRVTKLYGLLVHDADDLLVPGGHLLVSALQKLKKDGFVEKIGVSIYEQRQIDALLNIFTPDILQVPFNVMDQRLSTNGTLADLKIRKIEIHARSVFLQGLLLMPIDQIPAYFDPYRDALELWHNAVVKHGLTPSEAALSFVLSSPYIDVVLLGVESPEQVRANTNIFKELRRFVPPDFNCLSPLLTNPSLWKI